MFIIYVPPNNTFDTIKFFESECNFINYLRSNGVMIDSALGNIYWFTEKEKAIEFFKTEIDCQINYLDLQIKYLKQQYENNIFYKEGD